MSYPGKTKKREAWFPAHCTKDDRTQPLLAASLCGCCCLELAVSLVLFLLLISSIHVVWKVGREIVPLSMAVVADGRLSPSQVGDRIVTICGTPTEGMTHTQAVSFLKNASGSIEMQVRFLSQLFWIWVAWGHVSFNVKATKWLNLLLLYLLFPLNINDYIENSKKVHRKHILSLFILMHLSFHTLYLRGKIHGLGREWLIAEILSGGIEWLTF